jgi:hypothetical protein
MKKIFIIVTALFSTLLVSVGSNAQGTAVPSEVLNSFSSHFKNPQMSRWVAIHDSQVATFTMDGQNWKDAYFTNDGEFKGVGHYITFDQLPVGVQESLSNTYNKYGIIELYQFDGTESGICFFATMRNDKNTLTLKLDDLGYVAYSKKDKIKQVKATDALASSNAKPKNQ